MTRIPRRIAGIGASDLPDAAAFDAYVGPAREITVDPQRGIIALHDGVTPGGHIFTDTALTGKLFSGRVGISVSDFATGGDHLYIIPTDFGPGKPGLFVNQAAGQLNYNFTIWDSVSVTGTLQFNAQHLAHNGSTIWTSANADALNNVSGTAFSQNFKNLSDLTDVHAARVNLGVAEFRSPASNGDGTTDSTAAFNALITLINAGAVKTVVIPPGIHLVGKLNPVTASDITWLWQGSLKAKPDSLSTDEFILSITGNRHKTIGDIKIDGNKSAWSTTTGHALLSIMGDGHEIGIHVHDSKYQGCRLEITNFIISAFILQDNGNLGCEMAACAFGAIHGSQVNRNGFGQAAPNGAFGLAMRFRCHDIDFLGGDFSDNALDGHNINQGSYNIKVHAGRARDNGDGGFTMADDNVGSGRPGDGEVPYQISYFDCDTENNYTSGIVAYCAVHGLTISGGVQKNNHRLAGDLEQTSSFFNGVYVARGSTGLSIDTQAYDDRQERIVSAVSGSGATRVLTATGWVAGRMARFKKVAIYTSTGSFRGYGEITAEASDSVTIKSLPYNGVSLGAISVGDIVTQAVQHNGVFIDADSYGKVLQNGSSPRVGPSASIQGRSALIAAPGVVLDNGIRGPELLLNPGFETDLSNWVFDLPGGGESSRVTADARSVGALQLVGGTDIARGDAMLLAGAFKMVQGSNYLVTGMVWSDSVNAARVHVFRNTSPDVRDDWYSKGVGWEPFFVTGPCLTDQNALVFRVVAAAGKTVLFDNLSFTPLTELPTGKVTAAPY